METWYWLILLAVFIVIEIATMGLTTIWFAAGALVAYISALLGAPVLLQIAYFFIVSFILLFFTRPIAVRYFNQDREKTNIDGIIGRIGKVTADIDNLENKGTVYVDGKEWTARTGDDDKTIAKDAKIKVLAVAGVKLIVTDDID